MSLDRSFSRFVGLSMGPQPEARAGACMRRRANRPQSSHRPRLERLPPRIQVRELALDLLNTLEALDDRCGHLFVEVRIRNPNTERALLGLERLDPDRQRVE